MKVRLHGTPAETDAAARLLGEVVHVVSVSDPYPDRGRSELVRVYVEVRLPTIAGRLPRAPGLPAPDQPTRARRNRPPA